MGEGSLHVHVTFLPGCEGFKVGKNFAVVQHKEIL